MQQVRQLRKRLGLTQLEAAKLVGVAHRTYQRWEYGTCRTPAAALIVMQSLADRR